MSYRALALASVVALGANAAFAADGQENRAIRDEVLLPHSQPSYSVLEGRASVAAPSARLERRADEVRQPSYFDISERSNQN